MVQWISKPTLKDGMPNPEIFSEVLNRVRRNPPGVFCRENRFEFYISPGRNRREQGEMQAY